MYALSHEYRTAPTKVRKLLRKVAELEAATEAEKQDAITELLKAFKELEK